MFPARVLGVTALAALGLIAASCSEKSASDSERTPKNSQIAADPNGRSSSEETQESESRQSPGEPEAALEPGDIGEDCVAFLRATKAVPANRPSNNCPQCPGSDASVEVLKFNNIKIDRISCGESNCEVNVEIYAQFNPSSGGNIVGGLTGWISPEQREQYSRGKIPAGRQIYKVKVIYRREGDAWRAVEFGRADRD